MIIVYIQILNISYLSICEDLEKLKEKKVI